ncbi:MAG: TIGR02453 family protein, partial [Hyphomicrobiales bacterium]|nr:TIGR02453 family protein [Hyphomicrobiales bacterium]
MPFAGFGKEALPFFKALGFHQTRDWFEANRAIYEDTVKRPLGDLVEDVAAALARGGPPVTGNRKTSVFRIHRDTRFAKDKSPYKTNAGAALTRSGAKSDPGLVYVHVSPDGCFFAAGFYSLDPPALARLRRAAAREPKAYAAALRKLERAGLALDDIEDMKRATAEFADVTDPLAAAAV